MGRYMRKAKITGDIAVMEVSQSPLGVRTRAKTLALQRLQSLTTKPPSPPLHQNPESCYLQLRSRRLEKPPLLTKHQEQQQSSTKEGCGENPEKIMGPNVNSKGGSRLKMTSLKSGSVGSVSIFETEDKCDLGIEASFGENNLEFEARERSSRESTPCSLMRDSDIIAATPGSTTRHTSSTTAHRRIRNAMPRIIPTSQEMEEFFARAELEQQKKFIEKYNFDVVNDLPLPGRYEWVRVGP